MRKWKKRWSSLLLCAAMLVSLCVSAAAEEDTVEETGPETESVEYLDEDGAKQTYPSAVLVTDSDAKWENNWYVASGGVNITGRVNVTGDVYLILKDGCNLTVDGGINVGKGNSLTIYGQTDGTGKLTATGGDYDAGIGGKEVNSSGTIIINGGEVTATSRDGAGIGGGQYGVGGTVTISGNADVTATGSAGIGGDTITITDGEVTATGSSNGISGGSGGISLTGGTVKASSGRTGNGIACGGTITISGSTVIASGGWNGISINGSIKVTAGEVTANGSDCLELCGRAKADFQQSHEGLCSAEAGTERDENPSAGESWHLLRGGTAQRRV